MKEFDSLFTGKSVSVIGIGVSNRPLIHMLVRAGAKVIARDRNPIENPAELEDLGVKLMCGDAYLSDLREDWIFKTPGMRFDVPELVEAVDRGAVLTSEMEIFMDLCPTKNTIAVTGSDGKTTTTTLIAKMLEAGQKRVFLGGNIGNPLLPRLDEITPDDFVVLELSSFQLHTMKKSPHIAVMTNVTPNHLDMHKSYQEYIDAKCNIHRYQSADDVLIVNRGNEVTAACGREAIGHVRDFSYEGQTGCGIELSRDEAFGLAADDGMLCLVDGAFKTPLFRASEIAIPGRHNVENYMAACLAVRDYVDAAAMKSVAKTFGGVEHRLQLVRVLDGVKYYNSSIDSSPNRTKAALSVFREKVILLCGGKDKGIPYDEIGRPILDHVKVLIVTGMTAEKIIDAVHAEAQRTGESVPEIIRVGDYNALVAQARAHAKPGDVVLLSPASTSFDRFKNFMERGETFVRLVNELK